ncbi:helix-turn-helix domain-containing protein [Hyphomonadaceae bacterium ML37]|nr:helix-turn-helix domain-containing protein [Hyphomonadaceae bacterium ML37]
MPTPLKNSHETASYLGLSVSTLAKLRLTGEGPRYVRLGRRVLYDPADLDTWIASRKRYSTSDVAAAS